MTSSAQGLLLCSFVLSDAQDRATQVAECFVLDTARGPSQVVTGGPQGSFDEDGRGFGVHLCGSHWLKQSRSDKALLVSVKRFLVLMSKNPKHSTEGDTESSASPARSNVHSRTHFKKVLSGSSKRLLFMFKIINKALHCLCKTLGTLWSQDVLKCKFSFTCIPLSQENMK